MAKNDLDRARFVGEVAVYLGVVIATLAVGGLVGWVLPLAVDGRLGAAPSPLSRASYASERAPSADAAVIDGVAAVGPSAD